MITKRPEKSKDFEGIMEYWKNGMMGKMDTGCWLLDSRCRTLDSGYWMLVTGFWKTSDQLTVIGYQENHRT